MLARILYWQQHLSQLFDSWTTDTRAEWTCQKLSNIVNYRSTVVEYHEARSIAYSLKSSRVKFGGQLYVLECAGHTDHSKDTQQTSQETLYNNLHRHTKYYNINSAKSQPQQTMCIIIWTWVNVGLLHLWVWRDLDHLECTCKYIILRYTEQLHHFNTTRISRLYSMYTTCTAAQLMKKSSQIQLMSHEQLYSWAPWISKKYSN